MLAVFSHPSLFIISIQLSVFANFLLPSFFLLLISCLLISSLLSIFSLSITSIFHLSNSSSFIFFCFVLEKLASMYALRYSILPHYCPCSILTQIGYLVIYFLYSSFRSLPSVFDKISDMIFELYFL